MNNFFYDYKNLFSEIDYQDGIYLVTGANGSIGSAVVDSMLDKINACEFFKLILVSRSPEDLCRKYKDINGKNLVILDWKDLDSIDYVDYILHLASPTSSSDFHFHPSKTFNDILDYGRLILDLAVRTKAKSTLIASSLEVYGVINKDTCVNESYKLIYDFDSVRSSYSCAKIALESMARYCSFEHGVSVKVARMSPVLALNDCRNDKRLIPSLTFKAIQNDDVVLYSDGSTVRSYCFISDCISALMCLLYSESDFDIYNVANDGNIINVRDLATLIIELSESESGLVYKKDGIKSAIYPPVIKVIQDVSKLRSLGWIPQVGLHQMLNLYISYNNSL